MSDTVPSMRAIPPIVEIESRLMRALEGANQPYHDDILVHEIAKLIVRVEELESQMRTK